MAEIAGLIRQFPEGSFFLLIALIWGMERVGVAIAHRNRPLVQRCDCENCCTDDDEEDEEEE